MCNATSFGNNIPSNSNKAKYTIKKATCHQPKNDKIELTILKLGKKQKDKIKFNWKLYDGGGKLMDDNDYTFSAGKAMTKLNDKKISK